ncbi:MAG TPA: heme exporter protein CcmD [Burkholderiales bacterium]|nr:heme exporter protein CcmD [Burkholderiales bacterium]
MSYWQNLNDFLAMGGYGAYVWGAYAVSALSICLELMALRRRRVQAVGAIKKDA